MLKKLMMFAGLLGGSVLFSGQALAAADWGPCSPTNGTQLFNAVMNQTVTDVEKNTAGAVFPDFYAWDLITQYPGVCECPAGEETGEIFYKTVSSLTIGHISGGSTFYVVNNNIQIASEVFIGGNFANYKEVPFENASNQRSDRALCDVNNSDPAMGFSTGGKGKLTLYINHPFVGQIDIPQTKIVDVYGSRKSGVYGTTPIAEVSLSGSIIVPQGCELSSGSTLEIPFGDFKASDFKDRKGQIAKNATKFIKELQFKCTNISDGVKIFLRIEGMPNANDSNAIDMGNPDIGAVIEGANGNILVPNDTSVNQELSVSGLVDDTHRTASTTISAYPISTTGKLPAAGKFEGIATMSIDVE
ncbi:long polar fimbrial protein LpfD [Salmonella bongori]|uniref:long polar fimbrial protein LpfD n=1 Tax=Salmonella bongori TaxID=54736 RepID=UPI0009A96F8D|nr:long polar fimbrial protein LpfD [Salmonella bongori]EGE4655441.1 long polar fimbrial protein LpfD [Salmonella bongori serovar 40:z35:- str. 95-0123]EGE4659060.1 long polar fimbrial protein LpfD [Salmonella bongori serovar 48:i:- str. 94-0708]ECC8921002.1 long polar fimbrial protein LpfD [Salmonella bongori]ECC9595196.1 long polar fimbrial protein LpfD [Salmonella bongori]EDP8661329.1 long polar fimbrial protein LpfD [Salmonella bongori]